MNFNYNLIYTCIYKYLFIIKFSYIKIQFKKLILVIKVKVNDTKCSFPLSLSV